MEQDCPAMNMTLWLNVSMKWSCYSYTPSSYEVIVVPQVYSGLKFVSPAVEVSLSFLTLSSRTATTLSVTWSAGSPKCYSFTVSHSTQDGSINVTQPANSDTSHTLTSLQPGTTYRIEVEAVRKRDGADGQRAKVIGNFTTEEGEEYHYSEWRVFTDEFLPLFARHFIKTPNVSRGEVRTLYS